MDVCNVALSADFKQEMRLYRRKPFLSLTVTLVGCRISGVWWQHEQSDSSRCFGVCLFKTSVDYDTVSESIGKACLQTMFKTACTVQWVAVIKFRVIVGSGNDTSSFKIKIRMHATESNHDHRTEDLNVVIFYVSKWCMLISKSLCRPHCSWSI